MSETRGTALRKQRRRPTLAEIVAGELRDKILGGTLPDGASLDKQRELLDEFNVSGPSLREALRILENEGLVTVRRGNVGGALVHRPSATTVARMIELVLASQGATLGELSTTIEAVEALAAAMAARRPDRADAVVGRLRSLALAAGSKPSADGASASFHHTLVASCGNEALRVLYEALLAVWLAEGVGNAGTRCPSDLASPESVAAAARGSRLVSGGHDAILAAIEAGDPDAARLAARDHAREASPDAVAGRRLGIGEGGDGVSRAASGRGSGARSNRLAETVARALRGRIVDGELGEGSVLGTQEQLAVSLGVSIPSVREAIRMLEAEGLISVRRGSVGGTVVRAPTARNVAYNLALVLEGQAVTLRDVVVALQEVDPMCAVGCAKRSDRMSAVVPRLAARIDEAEEALGNPGAFGELAQAFHNDLVALCDNKVIALLVGALQTLWEAQVWGLQESDVDLGVIAELGERAAVLEEHRSILRHIAEGSGDEVEAAARAHFAHPNREPAFTPAGHRVDARLLYG